VILLSTLCKAVTKQGKPCKAIAQSGSDYCFFHDPNKSDKHKEARQKGGKNRCFPPTRTTLPKKTVDVVITSADDVISLLSETISQVRRGDIDPKVANSINQCANVILRAREQGDIDERIKKLAEKVGVEL